MRRDRGVLAPFRSLLAAQAAGTALGLLFWVVVARWVAGVDVGVAAAAISTQTLLGTVCALGLGTLLIAELPSLAPGRQRQLVVRCLAVVAAAGVLVGSGVALAARAGLLGDNLRDAVDGAGAVVVVGGVVAAGTALVLDEAVLGLGRSHVQVVRNVVAAGVRLPLAVGLVAAGHRTSTVLMLCWVLPLLLSVAGTLAALRLPRGPGGPAPAADVASYGATALRHHALTLSLAAGSQLMPVVAALTLTAVGNAEFTIAWLAATVVFLPPYLLAVALFAHGSRVSPEELRASMSTTLPAALGLSLLLCVGAWTLGRPVLHVFGAGYADRSWTLLALLVPAGLWMVVKDHLVALWRVERRFGLATRLAAAAVVLEVAGAVVGGVLGGGPGLAIGWLVATALEALVAVPLLRRAFAGISWQRPGLPVRVRGDRGAAPWALGAAVLVLVTAVGFGVVSAGGGSGDVEPAAESGALACPPTADRPGPLVDLGVQAAGRGGSTRLLGVRKVERLVGLAADAGATVISTSVSWRTVRPTRAARDDWAGLDRVVDAARARGLEVRVQVSGLPDWARDGHRGLAGPDEARPPLSDAELRRWGHFVERLVGHLDGRLTYLEAWPEPDGSATWATGPDPAAFARLLTTTADAVHRADPSVLVVSGSLAGNDLGFLDRVYDELDGADVPFDLIGLHPYTNGVAPLERAPDARYAGPFGTVDESFLGYRDVHALTAEHGDADRPLYLGEIGWSTEAWRASPGTPDATRAEYVGQVLGAATCTPYVVAVSWYYLHPTPWNDPAWTLLDEDLRPNLTYRALQQWGSAVKDVS